MRIQLLQVLALSLCSVTAACGATVVIDVLPCDTAAPEAPDSGPAECPVPTCPAGEEPFVDWQTTCDCHADPKHAVHCCQPIPDDGGAEAGNLDGATVPDAEVPDAAPTCGPCPEAFEAAVCCPAGSSPGLGDVPVTCEMVDAGTWCCSSVVPCTP